MSLHDSLPFQNVFLAIVFHDVVYDPKSRTNEEDTVDVFRAFAAVLMEFQVNILTD